MPGTFGTLVGVLIFQLISLNSLLNNIFLLLVLFFLSLLLLNYSYKKSIFLNKDDKSIVIDEIFGYLIFMIFFENNPMNLLVGFMLFRFFDILKPFPISLIDKNIKNSFGVMFDDVIAALFSGVGLFLFNYVY
jgi:phosphatidylglycerophosphatase A